MEKFMCGYVVGATAMALVSFVMSEIREDEKKCIVNTHLTPEQYTVLIGDESQFFAVDYNGDVLALVDCKYGQDVKLK